MRPRSFTPRKPPPYTRRASYSMGERSELTRNAILRISDQKTIQLIQDIEKEESLWNTNLLDYPNKEERLYATQIIAEKLGIQNFGPEHVTMKFKNLRNSYCQELRKMSTDKKYKPKVFWFSYMDKFLKPHLQKVKTNLDEKKVSESKSTTDIKTEVIICNDDQEDWSIENSTQSPRSETSCANSIQIESTYSELLYSSATGESSQQSTAKKRKLSEESTRPLEDTDKRQSISENGECSTGVQINKNKTLKIQEPSEKGLPESGHRKVDYLDTFGAYIVSLLRTLPPKQALMLQPAILEMIVSVGVDTLDKQNDSDA